MFQYDFKFDHEYFLTVQPSYLEKLRAIEISRDPYRWGPEQKSRSAFFRNVDTFATGLGYLKSSAQQHGQCQKFELISTSVTHLLGVEYAVDDMPNVRIDEENSQPEFEWEALLESKESLTSLNIIFSLRVLLKDIYGCKMM